MQSKKYRLGIDVGINSLGICAVEVADDGCPLGLLNSQVIIHDGGVDPTAQKTAGTRLAVSGVARRTRRLVRRRRQRLFELDQFITEQGWPLVELSASDDPFLPWRVRAELADGPVRAEERGEKISIALRHIARHRGWRNPFARVESLHDVEEESEFFQSLRSRVEDGLGYELPQNITSAQIVACVGIMGGQRLRGNDEKSGVFAGKLHQSDNAREIRKIFRVQGLSDQLAFSVIDEVFTAMAPGAKSAERVGKDPLPGQNYPRALKASLAFEEYRVAAALANVRVVDGPRLRRRLTSQEMTEAFRFLTSQSDESIMWGDVAHKLGLPSASLRGAAVDLDGERLSAKPPVMISQARIHASKISPLNKWWRNADLNDKEHLIRVLAHGEEPDGSLGDLLSDLDDKNLANLDKIHLVSGRAAYSEDSLRRLTARMLRDACDLHTARKMEFGVDDDWQPPAPSIGEPVGNPATDRVLKETARVIGRLRAIYGDPLSVNIEHVREGFSSARMANQRDRENQRRYKKNQETVKNIMEEENLSSPPRWEDVRRYNALQRQHGNCLYCGDQITFRTAEMDHIIPRAGAGSTNTMNNLVAICRRCNQLKGKTIFSQWANECGVPGVSLDEAIERVKMWDRDPAVSSAAFKRFQREVILRLKRADEDPEIDGRSMESVAWMARELRRRVDQEIPSAMVNVYRGELTAEARKASGLEKVVPYIGGPGKTRFDRRHHAVDAAVIAMMRPAVAKTLAERIELRKEQRYSAGEDSRKWKTHQGDDSTLYQQWLLDMRTLAGLLKLAFTEDRIPVRRNLRLRLANSAIHDDTIHKFKESGCYHLGDELPVAIIDRAGTPALWCALTREPDFDSKKGLPKKDDRTVKVNGTLVTADEVIPIGPNRPFVLVRNGYAGIGGNIHHARIYRFAAKGKSSYGMIRVFGQDLQHHLNEDLFNVTLPLQSISLRMSDKKVRAAVVNGKAEYLGWIVTNDELFIDMSSSMELADMKVFNELLPGTCHWRISGFEDASRLTLKPAQLADEGLSKIGVHESSDSVSARIAASKEVHKIFDKGWRANVNKLILNHHPVVIRRDSLGRVRLTSRSHLPITWDVTHGTMAGG